MIVLQNSNVDQLDFANLHSEQSVVKFNDVEFDSLNLTDSSIKNFHWNLITIKKQIKIIRCNLDGLKLNNVKWLKNKALTPDLINQKINKSNLKDLRYQRDAYRQLKAASIVNHNHIEALAFYKNEMRLYWKEIRLVGGEKWYDIVLIFLSRWVSNFGQSWAMPLVWLLGTHLVWCFLIWNFEAYHHCGPGTSCENNIGSGFAEYFTWLNPIFKTPQHWTNGALITSFFMRIFNSFFIYHFIRATRKFAKV